MVAKPQQPQAGTQQAAQTSSTAEPVQEQHKEAAQSRPQEQAPQQQAKIPPAESTEESRRNAEEHKQAEKAQQVTDLLTRAHQQKAAQRLIAPKGNNALETYREVLRIAPDHTEAKAGLQEIKEQSKQLGEAAEQQGEWAKAQGHYEAALAADPQDTALKTALQQVKQAQKESATLAGRYETTAPTPVLKEPRPDAAVIRNLPSATKVTVVGAVGDYMRVQSKKGNPPGYIARQAVTRSHKEPEPTDYIEAKKSVPSTQEEEVYRRAEERNRYNPENALVGKWLVDPGYVNALDAYAIEFLKGGSAVAYKRAVLTGRNITVPGTYQIIDGNHLRFNSDSTDTYQFSVSGDELIVSRSGVTVLLRRVR